jgi:hypothetical protein
VRLRTPVQRDPSRHILVLTNSNRAAHPYDSAALARVAVQVRRDEKLEVG